MCRNVGARAASIMSHGSDDYAIRSIRRWITRRNLPAESHDYHPLDPCNPNPGQKMGRLVLGAELHPANCANLITSTRFLNDSRPWPAHGGNSGSPVRVKIKSLAFTVKRPAFTIIAFLDQPARRIYLSIDTRPHICASILYAHPDQKTHRKSRLSIEVWPYLSRMIRLIVFAGVAVKDRSCRWWLNIFSANRCKDMIIAICTDGNTLQLQSCDEIQAQIDCG